MHFLGIRAYKAGLQERTSWAQNYRAIYSTGLGNVMGSMWLPCPFMCL